MDILPLLDISRGKEAQDNILATDHQSSVGGYVRFWVERSPSPTDAARRMYGAERRNPIQRFFAGRSRTRLLTARLVVDRSQLVTQTITLAAASHNSNRRQGENWSSELSDRRFLTPYFRVDQGTTASVEVALSASATVDSDVTRNLLSVVERGARLAAPSAPLVTSLTGPRLTESADFVDSSISQLFGQAVAERSQSDFAAEAWDAGSTQALATISAVFPMGRSVWAQPQSIVGSWDIRVSAPIVSIFSSVPLHASDEHSSRGGQADPAAADPCAMAGALPGEAEPQRLTGTDRQACLAFRGLAPSRVLGLPVGENVTLGGALRADTAITAAIQRYDGTDAKDPAAHELCVLVVDRAEALGLNAYDSAAALWALSSSGGINAGASQKIWNGTCAAARLARRLNLVLNVSSPNPEHVDSSTNGKPTTGQATPPLATPAPPGARDAEAQETPGS
jgi:hypothetical protein